LRPLIAVLIPAFFASILCASEENPFVAVRDRYQWGIEQVMAHKPLEPLVDAGVEQGPSTKPGKTKARKPAETAPSFKTQVYQFQTETDKAKVGVELTDMGSSFIVDLTSDQVIEGWLLKRQSTREVFLKGSGQVDNPYKCRIRVDRPYIHDFGLTVYVTKDSDPAFIQLF
jgi:hypothetical protein